MYISYEEMITVRGTEQHAVNVNLAAGTNDELCLSMMQNLKDSVVGLSQFLGKFLDGEVINKISNRCLFKNMKKNNMSNYSVVPTEFMDQRKSEFLRKGGILYYYFTHS